MQALIKTIAAKKTIWIITGKHLGLRDITWENTRKTTRKKPKVMDFSSVEQSELDVKEAPTGSLCN